MSVCLKRLNELSIESKSAIIITQLIYGINSTVVLLSSYHEDRCGKCCGFEIQSNHVKLSKWTRNLNIIKRKLFAAICLNGKVIKWRKICKSFLHYLQSLEVYIGRLKSLYKYLLGQQFWKMTHFYLYFIQ